jgi:catalase
MTRLTGSRRSRFPATAIATTTGPGERERLAGNIAEAMQGVPEEIQRRQIIHFAKADLAYGASVARRLGLDLGSDVAAQ